MKISIVRLVCVAACFCVINPSFAWASRQPFDFEGGQILNISDGASVSLDWSLVCSTENYHPRDAAIADALSRAESSSSRPVSQEKPLPAETGRPIITPVPREVPAAPREVERADVIDEALDSYLEFQKRQNILDAGIEIFSFEYEEEGLMREKGSMYGVFAEYRYRFHQNPPMVSLPDISAAATGINVLMLDWRFSMMRDGHYQAENIATYGEVFDEKFYANEFRVMGGYELPIESKRLIVMPYAGLGYRYLLDDNGGRTSTTGAYAYDRESQYLYMPIGVEARKFYNRGWSTRLTAEYDWFITGRQKSHMGFIPGYHYTVEKNQPKGYGLRTSLRLSKSGERLDFFVEPFARYWNIENSDIACSGDGCFYEPRNTTEEYGARMGFRF